MVSSQRQGVRGTVRDEGGERWSKGTDSKELSDLSIWEVSMCRALAPGSQPTPFTCVLCSGAQEGGEGGHACEPPLAVPSLSHRE